MVGICIRMELYVVENQWKRCDDTLIHDLLNSFVLYTSERFEEKKNLNIINKRFAALEESNQETIQKALNKIR
jgi:hypothetical protein